MIKTRDHALKPRWAASSDKYVAEQRPIKLTCPLAVLSRSNNTMPTSYAVGIKQKTSSDMLLGHAQIHCCALRSRVVIRHFQKIEISPKCCGTSRRWGIQKNAAARGMVGKCRAGSRCTRTCSACTWSPMMFGEGLPLSLASVHDSRAPSRVSDVCCILRLLFDVCIVRRSNVMLVDVTKHWTLYFILLSVFRAPTVECRFCVRVFFSFFTVGLSDIAPADRSCFLSVSVSFRQ